MRIVTSLLSVLLLVAARPVAAGEPAVAGGGTGTVFDTPSVGVRGILDPSKLSVSHSISYAYVTGSGSGPRGGAGLYQSDWTYRLSDPLRVTVHLGYRFSSPVGPSLQEGGETNLFLPGISVHYRPSEKFQFLFQYRRVPSPYYPYAPYGYGAWDAWR